MTIIDNIAKLLIHLFNYAKKVQEILECILIESHTVKITTRIASIRKK